MGGLSDKVLKRKIFKVCDLVRSEGSMRKFCTTYKVAARDADTLPDRVAQYTGSSNVSVEGAVALLVKGEVASTRLPTTLSIPNIFHLPTQLTPLPIILVVIV